MFLSKGDDNKDTLRGVGPGLQPNPFGRPPTGERLMSPPGVSRQDIPKSG